MSCRNNPAEREAYNRAYYRKHRKRIKARNKAYAQTHKKQRNARHSELLRERQVFGLCPICQVFDGKLVRDHDHNTGKWRQPICHQCNLMLGLAKDNTKTLRRAANYLTRHRAG